MVCQYAHCPRWVSPRVPSLKVIPRSVDNGCMIEIHVRYHRRHSSEIVKPRPIMKARQMQKKRKRGKMQKKLKRGKMQKKQKRGKLQKKRKRGKLQKKRKRGKLQKKRNLDFSLLHKIRVAFSYRQTQLRRRKQKPCY